MPDLIAVLDAIRPPPPRKPTVGSVVHYQRAQAPLLPLGHPQASIVTRVFGDGDGMIVAIECFGDSEKVLHRGVPYATHPQAGYWSWPPR
jgi:hypothetical protein